MSENEFNYDVKNQQETDIEQNSGKAFYDRRTFLKNALLFGVSATLAACMPPTNNSQEHYTGAPNEHYQQQNPYQFNEIHIPELFVYNELREQLTSKEMEYISAYAKEYINYYGNARGDDKFIMWSANNLGSTTAGSYAMFIDIININMLALRSAKAGVEDLLAVVLHEMGHANLKERHDYLLLRNRFTVPNLGEMVKSTGLSLYYSLGLDVLGEERFGAVYCIEEACVDFCAKNLLLRNGVNLDKIKVGYPELAGIMNFIHDAGWMKDKEISAFVQNGDFEGFVKSLRGKDEIDQWDLIATVCWFQASQEDRLLSGEIFTQMKEFRGKNLSLNDFRSVINNYPQLFALKPTPIKMV